MQLNKFLADELGALENTNRRSEDLKKIQASS